MDNRVDRMLAGAHKVPLDPHILVDRALEVNTSYWSDEWGYQHAQWYRCTYGLQPLIYLDRVMGECEGSWSHRYVHWREWEGKGSLYSLQ